MHDERSDTAYLTGDIARLIDRSEATVRQDVARGRLRASLRTPHGIRVFTEADVAAYLAQRRRRAA